MMRQRINRVRNSTLYWNRQLRTLMRDTKASWCKMVRLCEVTLKTSNGMPEGQVFAGIFVRLVRIREKVGENMNDMNFNIQIDMKGEDRVFIFHLETKQFYRSKG